MNQPAASDTVVEEITIRAPARKVFAALTSPEELVKWWGTEGRFKTTHAECELRPGGKWLMSGIGVGGRPFTIQGVYREIMPPQVLAFTWLPSWQENATETLVRFDFAEKDGVTTVRLTHFGLDAQSSRAHRGWPDVLAWLKSHAERST